LGIEIHSHIPLLSTGFPPLIVQIVICGLAFAQGKSGIVTLKAIALLEKPIPFTSTIHQSSLQESHISLCRFDFCGAEYNGLDIKYFLFEGPD
jgi:hypothetical protein